MIKKQGKPKTKRKVTGNIFAELAGASVTPGNLAEDLASGGNEIHPRQNDPIRLNVGAGDIPLDGYTPIDRKQGKEAYPLEYEDNSVDEIRASHVLEHFGHGQILDVVKHWVSKLKPGGLLRIAVPDFEKIAKSYLGGINFDVQGFVMGGQIDGNDFHGTVFDAETLKEVFLNAGLERIAPWTSEIIDQASRPLSVNLCGYKPGAESFNPKAIVAVLASARYGPAMHHRCVDESLNILGIPSHVFCGCFWHQILCETMEKYIADPAIEYVITTDYDTIFRKADVAELCRLMRACPDVDAIVPMQWKRNSDAPLLNMGRGDGPVYTHEFDRHLTRIFTGHFGLTILRAASLRKMTRPWMVPVPDEEGRWSEKKVDADIYFWHKWKDEGFSVYVANNVKVGHLEELITWPGPDFKPIHQNLSDYATDGMPGGVHHEAMQGHIGL